MLMLLSHGMESRVLCEEAVRIATEVDAKAELGHALNSLGVDLALMGDFDAGLQHLYRAKEIALELDSIDDLGRAYANIPSLLVWAGRYEEALEYWNEGIEAVTRKGAGGSYGSWYRADKSEVLFRLGRWDEAESVTREPGSESGSGRAMRLCTRAQVATARGRLDDARADLDEARSYSLGMREPQYVGPYARVRAQLAFAEGDSLKARIVVRETLTALEDSEELADRALLCFLGMRAEANLAAKDNASVELAQKLLDEVRQIRSASDDHPQADPVVGASAASAEAEMSRLVERADPEAWEVAASLWEKAGHLYREAYCLFRQSEASLTTGGADARDPLLRASELATRLGAAPLLTEIQSLARRGRISLGEPLRRRGPSTSLTPREIDVLRLVADGKSNSEIGRELFISTKTASVHVSHILQKLGVSSRVQAAGAARDMISSREHSETVAGGK
jgi:ATP/maltotriose-dependent transcriptional regulator MalT